MPRSRFPTFGGHRPCPRRGLAGLPATSLLLLLEPLASGVVPWWPEWGTELGRLGVADIESKARVEVPEWIARVDRAAGLDHRVIGARVLAGPLDPAAP